MSMSGELITIVIMGAVIVLQRLELFWQQRSAAHERRALCDRLQAGTLRDYRDNAPSMTTEPAHATGGDLGTDGGEIMPESAAPPAGPPETSVVDARMTFEKDLMGGARGSVT